MTQQKPRKPRTTFTIEQKLDYAKLMTLHFAPSPKKDY
jgi:hypothetical protein